MAVDILEEEFQSQLLEVARLKGLLAYHTRDSRRSTRGFPDLVLVGSKGVLFRELKTRTGKVTPEQKDWINALTVAGQDAGVWRPADMKRAVQEMQAIR